MSGVPRSRPSSGMEGDALFRNRGRCRCRCRILPRRRQRQRLRWTLSGSVLACNAVRWMFTRGLIRQPVAATNAQVSALTSNRALNRDFLSGSKLRLRARLEVRRVHAPRADFHEEFFAHTLALLRKRPLPRSARSARFPCRAQRVRFRRELLSPETRNENNNHRVPPRRP